jgi:preprotein translocase subunit SecE
MNYIKGVIEEMKKVTWLNADQTARDTGYVVISSLLFSIFLSAVGFISKAFITWLINN